MFQTPEDSQWSSLRAQTTANWNCLPDADELVPEDGKDEIYDNVMSEINDLEDELNRIRRHRL